MADTLNSILSVISTTASRLPDLAIKDGQLIFVKDRQQVALDIGSKRTFYNQITILQTESERQSMLAPISGLFYFVIENAVLWHYDQNWIQITTPPDDIVFIGTTFPELGSNKSVYINRTQKNISIWDESQNDYVVVADKTESITNAEILDLFK